jgi:hypothetical protein
MVFVELVTVSEPERKKSREKGNRESVSKPESKKK